MDRATAEISTLSLHDALPISLIGELGFEATEADVAKRLRAIAKEGDRKSTRLNSSHMSISYAVFCLKKKPEDLPLRRVAPALRPPSPRQHGRHLSAASSRTSR